MANLQVYRFPEGKIEQREADVTTLGKRPHRRLLRQAVLMYAGNQRAGTHCTKTRAEVNFTNKKPWAQKHTGRARAGTRRSPLWRGGGVIHGPRTRDYSWNMPRKSLRAAMRSALLGKFQDDEVSAMDGVTLEAPSTKRIAAALKSLGVSGTTLLVTPVRDDLLYKSARNIEGTRVRPAAEVTAFDLLAHRHVVLVNGAFEPLMKASGASEKKPGRSMKAAAIRAAKSAPGTEGSR